MSAPRRERPEPRPTAEAEAWTALLRREQQLDAIQRSAGWRLLSYYGPYKRRYVQPAWRRIRGLVARWLRPSAGEPLSEYEQWARYSDRLRDVSPAALAVRARAGTSVLSVVITVDPASVRDLDAAVASALEQCDVESEVWIGCIGGVEPTVLRSGFAADPRLHIDLRRHATHAAATNALIAESTATIVALMPPAVVFASDALVSALAAFEETSADLVYSDEDLCDDRGMRHSPQLKPGWSPDLLLSCLYWSRAVFYRRAFLERILPLPSEIEGAHFYDLALRAVEQRAQIVHVPRMLAHVRSAPTPTGGPATVSEREAGQRVLAAALARRGIAGAVRWHEAGNVYRVQREIARHATVSIIIPTRDGLAMLERCLSGVEAADHPRFAIVIVDNGSVEPATLAFLEKTRHRVLRVPGPFNFARLNNVAVGETDGEMLLFLNNDTEPLGPDWLRALEEHALRPEVGAVGAKLLYPDGTIQHAGIAVGIGGVAGHPYRFRRVAPESIRNVSAVTGACLMMRREVYDRVGGFDERLPVNSNDVDLCLRLREQGYRVVYTPHAVLYHYESQSRGRRAIPDDAWLMTRRWSDVIRADPYYNPNGDLAEETGDMDLSKPDGFVCLYGGSGRGEGTLRVTAGASVGQGFFVSGADLAAVVVRGTVHGDDPERAVRLTIRESAESRDAVRTVERAIVGRTNEEHWFCFAPIVESAGRHWYFELTVREGCTLVAERRAVVSDVMGPCFEHGAPSYGALVFQLFAGAPYRCAVSDP